MLARLNRRAFLTFCGTYATLEVASCPRLFEAFAGTYEINRKVAGHVETTAFFANTCAG